MSGLDVLDTFAWLAGTSLNEKFSKLHAEAAGPFRRFDDAFDAAHETDPVLMDLAQKYAPHEVIAQANGKLLENGTAVLKEGGDKVAFDAAMAEVKKIREQVDAYLKGGKYKIGDMEHTVPEPLKKAFLEAETAAKKVVKPSQSFVGMVRTQEKGFTAALKRNGDSMNGFKEGLNAAERGKAFAHGGMAVGAVVGMGDAMFRSKTSDGEDRSTAMRVLQAVGFGAIGTVALLGGKAAMAARV